jgi:hypothetical protein
MGVTWRILSPLSAREMLEVERECERSLEDYLRRHSEPGLRWGEFSAGGSLPDRGEVEREYRRMNLRLPPTVRERLEGCQSVMTIDAPADLQSSPLQVSLLRFILGRTGEALMMFNDYPLEETDAVLQGLRSRRGAPDFPDAPPRERPRRAPGEQRPPAEVRALRILEVIRHAEGNMDLAVDLRDALNRLPPLARRYLTLLYEEGILDDLKASRLLGVEPEELEPAIHQLSRALAEIAQT